MAKGHVKLGALGETLREYIIMPERWRKAQANPWTTKLNTGGDKYDDLEPFSFHVEQDWQAGVGHKSEDAGGFLFSTAETRVPGQVMLPQNILYTDLHKDTNDLSVNLRNLGIRSAISIDTYTAGTSKQGFAIKFTISGTTTLASMFLLARASYDCEISGRIRRTSPTGAFVDNLDISSSFVFHEGHAGVFLWQEFNSPAVTFSADTYYMVITVHKGSISLVSSSNVGGEETQVYNGSSWSTASPNLTPWLVWRQNTWKMHDITAITRFNGSLYAASKDLGYLYKHNASDNNWAAISALPQNATSVVVFNDVLYVGQATGNFRNCSTSDTLSDGGSTGAYFAKWNGILYKATTTDLWYSANGSTWSGPFTVCKSPEVITGIVGAQDTVWITTTDAIYYLAPGNVVRGVTRWGSSRPNNGTSPVNWQGTIYCIADGGVAQVNVAAGSVNMLPIWVGKNNYFVSSFLNNPITLAVTNNWLVATVQAAGHDLNNSTVWAYNGHGWHCIAQLPQRYSSSAYYDFHTSNIWIGGEYGVSSVRFPDQTTNPINDPDSLFFPVAWVETPWIDGGLVDIVKDFESVYIRGSEINPAGQNIKVYWQTVDRNYAMRHLAFWNELGTISTLEGGELRWSNPDTRPAKMRIKLGFLLFSDDRKYTPNIEAIRLKFRHNVEDRWGWTLIMPIHDNQQMVDGDVNPYTRDQIKAHLESLVKSTPPFSFEDVDGEQYTVICAGYELNLNQYQYYDDSNQQMYMAAVSLEQYITEA